MHPIVVSEEPSSPAIMCLAEIFASLENEATQMR